MCQISLVCLLWACGAAKFQIAGGPGKPHQSWWWLLWEREVVQAAHLGLHWVPQRWQCSLATLGHQTQTKLGQAFTSIRCTKPNTLPIKVRGELIHHDTDPRQPTWLIDVVFCEFGRQNSFCFLTDSSRNWEVTWNAAKADESQLTFSYCISTSCKSKLGLFKWGASGPTEIFSSLTWAVLLSRFFLVTTYEV